MNMNMNINIKMKRESDVWMVNTVDSGERAIEFLNSVAVAKKSLPEIFIIDQVNTKYNFITNKLYLIDCLID